MSATSQATRYFARPSGFAATSTRSAVIAGLLIKAGWLEVSSEDHETIKVIAATAQDKERPTQRSKRSESARRRKVL